MKASFFLPPRKTLGKSYDGRILKLLRESQGKVVPRRIRVNEKVRE